MDIYLLVSVVSVLSATSPSSSRLPSSLLHRGNILIRLSIYIINQQIKGSTAYSTFPL